MNATSSTLSSDEQISLQRLERKLQHIRDAVRGVVKEYHTGLFLHGEGGTSKSYTVTQELQNLKANYVQHNSRLTGRGLVDALQRMPSAVHWIEDAETLLEDRRAWGVLRSALWSQSTRKPIERPISWGAMNTQIQFTFTGGIIVVSNANLADSIPEVRAIKTRINVLGMDISPDEIKALMKQICSGGYKYGDLYLTEDECLEVREFVIDKLTELRRGLDLRLMKNGFHDYLQWKQNESQLHWSELLLGRMSERVTAYRDRRQQNIDKQKAALEIRAMNIPWNEQVQLANQRLGMSQSSYARALKRKI